MAKGSAGLGLAAGAGVVAVVAGVWTIWGQGEAPPAGQEPAALMASPTTEAAAPAVVPEPALPPEAPRFDVVRVDGGGLATVAGTGAPGGVVSLRLDGAEVARLVADGTGQFATVLTLPPAEQPRTLSLALVLPDGSEVAGLETVALAPVAAPQAQVAAATEAPAPAALLVSPEGVTVLQSGTVALDLPVLPISIDSIAYGAAGEVLLGGRATPAASLRIYMNDAPLAEVLADADGTWQAKLEDVAAGLHVLRADEIDASGKVLSRFETPFKREVPVAAPAIDPPVAEVPVAEASVSDPPVAEAPVAAAPVAVAPVAEAPVADVAVAGTAAATVTQAPAAEAPAAEAPVAETPVAASDAAEAPAPVIADAAPQVAPAPITITVQPGLTLWAIARENFGEGIMYVQVFEANRDKIKDPDLIYPGQIFTVPKP